MRRLPLLIPGLLATCLSLFPVAARTGTAAEPAPEPAARVATIEATAPLADQSEGAVRAAITTAVQTAARGALAMGLPWVHIQSAYVRPGFVGVQVVAMAAPPAEDPATPDSGTGDDRDDPPPDRPSAEPPVKYRL